MSMPGMRVYYEMLQPKVFTILLSGLHVMIWEDLQAMLLLPEFVIQIVAAHSSVFPFYLDYFFSVAFL
jgi:hypothetical protein